MPSSPLDKVRWLTVILGLALLPLTISNASAACVPATREQAAPETARELTLHPSSVPGVVDLFLAGNPIHNLVPVISWTDAEGIHYNSTEIQGAQVALTTLGDGYLLEYDRSSAQEVVRSAPPQPPSQVQFSLRVARADEGLVIYPASIDNPRDLELRLGTGCYYGQVHATRVVELETGTGRWALQPQVRQRAGGPGSMGAWHSLPGVTEAHLLSGRPTSSLSLRLAEGSGQADLEIRDQPWLPSATTLAPRGGWIEAVILYAYPEQYPLTLSVRQ